MATVYQPKGRKIYRIEFKDQYGVYRKISSGTKDKRIAEGLAMKLEEDTERIRFGKEPQHADLTGFFLGLVVVNPAASTWKVFRQRYEAEYLSGLRERSREKARMVLDIFEQTCQPRTVQSIDEQTISTFAAQLGQRPILKRGKPTGKIGLATWTIKNYLVARHKALKWAADQKMIRAVPTFPVVKVPKLRPQPIDEADWLKLLTQAPDLLWRAYLLCGWCGGLRLSEAHRLRRNRSEDWPWLDLPGDRIVLPALLYLLLQAPLLQSAKMDRSILPLSLPLTQKAEKDLRAESPQVLYFQRRGRDSNPR